MTMPFYVSPEQLMKDRADYARKGIARGRARRRAVRRRHRLRRREPLAGAAQGQRDLRPHRVRRGRQLQRVREPPDRRRPAGRHARLLLRPPRRHRPRPGQRLRPDARHDLLQRRREALRGGDLRRRGRRHGRGRPDLPAHLRRTGRRRARLRGHGWLDREGRRRTSRSTTRPAPPSTTPSSSPCRPSVRARPRPARSRRATSRSRCWTAPAPSSASSSASPQPSCAGSSATAPASHPSPVAAPHPTTRPTPGGPARLSSPPVRWPIPTSTPRGTTQGSATCQPTDAAISRRCRPAPWSCGSPRKRGCCRRGAPRTSTCRA